MEWLLSVGCYIVHNTQVNDIARHVLWYSGQATVGKEGLVADRVGRCKKKAAATHRVSQHPPCMLWITVLVKINRKNFYI